MAKEKKSMTLKVFVLFSAALFLVKVNAGPIVERSDLNPTSVIRSPQKVSVHKSGFSSDNASIQPMSAVAASADEDGYQVSTDPTLQHRSFNVLTEEGQKTRSNNLKYGVTNIGSRQHRYGEGTWYSDQEKTQNIENDNSYNNNINNNNDNINSKSVPRRKEKSLADMDTPGHVFDPPSAIKENDDHKDIVAIDNHGQLHTLALPMTILPGN